MARDIQAVSFMLQDARQPATPPHPTLAAVDWTQVDFIDLGCSKGGSLRMCRDRFGGRGLGIDIDPAKVAIARARGVDAVAGDATRLPSSCHVRFVSMIDFLEHLPDIEAVRDVIGAAANVATDFIFVSHPSFEGEGYLEMLGFRQYWWAWKGHPVHPKVSDYCEIFNSLGLRQYMIRNEEPVHDSQHKSIHTTSTRSDQGPFDSSRHPPKEDVRFTLPLWRAQSIYVALRAFEPDEWRRITDAGGAANRLAQRRMARKAARRTAQRASA